MKMKSIPLRSVRPFVYEEMILDKPDTENFEEIDPKQQTEECLDKKMKTILDKIKQDLKGMQSCITYIVINYNKITFSKIGIDYNYFLMGQSNKI